MLSFAAASSHHALLSPASCLTHFCPTLSPSRVFVSGFRSCGLPRLVSRDSDTGFEFSGGFEVKNRGFSRKGHCCSCWCARGWGCQGDLALEAEILDFMNTSEKPEAFPTRKELLAAGRMDLVEAIQRQGGWLALGWDLDGEDNDVQASDFKHSDFSTVERECNNGTFQERTQVDVGNSLSSSFEVDSACSVASSSGRDVAANDESGIEGILSRLEKERNMNLGFDLRGKGDVALPGDGDIDNGPPSHTSLHATVAGLRKSQTASFGENRSKSDGLRSKFSQSLALSGIGNSGNSPKPEMWSNRSLRGAGFSDLEFQGAKEGNEIIEVRDVSNESCRSNKSESFSEELNHDQIQICLEQLELELSSVLHSVRSNASEMSSQSKVDGSSSDDLQKLSDTWEFQENEVMNAKDKLRSMRAKLAVLEGKMALALIDAQKMVEEKQKRIDDAHRALRLLRTACIVWPNSASEVLLAGSFDGWATQRTMEKSRAGVFSLYLKLYPGRYEIKFVVDGEWKIDPLRPVVYNNGHDNNLLIIT